MNLELLILKCLANVEPRLMPEGVLLGDVRAYLQRAVPKGEIDLKLRSLESAGQIVGVENRDLGNQWKITDAGKARLIESNQ